MEELRQYLPFIIPYVALVLGLQIAAVVSILRKKHYKKGNMALWLIVSIFVNFLGIGPILYFVFGRADD